MEKLEQQRGKIVIDTGGKKVALAFDPFQAFEPSKRRFRTPPSASFGPVVSPIGCSG